MEAEQINLIDPLDVDNFAKFGIIMASKGHDEMNQTQLFSQYNEMKKFATERGLDPKRVNRALGILQSKDAEARLQKYNATVTNCQCPDYAVRGQTCKHRIARMIEAFINKKFKQYVKVRFYAHTYDPRSLFGRFDYENVEVLDGQVEVFQNGQWRLAQGSDVFVTMREAGFEIESHELVGQRRSPAWAGRYVLTISREK